MTPHHHAEPANSRLLWLVHKDVAALRKQVAKALRNGTLIRPSHCSACGECTAVVLHHEREHYHRPLTGEWLCRPCHGARHAEHHRNGTDPLLAFARDLVLSGTSRTVNELLALETKAA